MEIIMNDKLIEGYFHKRINRFLAEVYINDIPVKVHVPNSGRMKELLIKDRKVLVKKVNNEKRKTKYNLVMVFFNDILVAIDSKLPNLILYKGFKEKKLKYFDDYIDVKKEVTYGNSRFDIGLIRNNKSILIEAKCVTLVKDKVAMFPDAPTSRGTKHIEELMKAKKNGFDTAVFFIIQRKDADIFTPNWEMDFSFSQALQKAYNSGVMIKPLVCNVSKSRISIHKEINLKF